MWFVGGYIHAISPNSYNTNTEAKSPIARSSKATESEKFKVDAACGEAKVEIGKDGIVVLLFKRK